jgi:hypothetical protein
MQVLAAPASLSSPGPRTANASHPRACRAQAFARPKLISLLQQALVGRWPCQLVAKTSTIVAVLEFLQLCEKPLNRLHRRSHRPYMCECFCEAKRRQLTEQISRHHSGRTRCAEPAVHKHCAPCCTCRVNEPDRLGKKRQYVSARLICNVHHQPSFQPHCRMLRGRHAVSGAQWCAVALGTQAESRTGQ